MLYSGDFMSVETNYKSSATSRSSSWFSNIKELLSPELVSFGKYLNSNGRNGNGHGDNVNIGVLDAKGLDERAYGGSNGNGQSGSEVKGDMYKLVTDPSGTTRKVRKKYLDDVPDVSPAQIDPDVDKLYNILRSASPYAPLNGSSSVYDPKLDAAIEFAAKKMYKKNGGSNGSGDKSSDSSSIITPAPASEVEYTSSGLLSKTPENPAEDGILSDDSAETSAEATSAATEPMPEKYDETQVVSAENILSDGTSMPEVTYRADGIIHKHARKTPSYYDWISGKFDSYSLDTLNDMNARTAAYKLLSIKGVGAKTAGKLLKEKFGYETTGLDLESMYKEVKNKQRRKTRTAEKYASVEVFNAACGEYVMAKKEKQEVPAMDMTERYLEEPLSDNDFEKLLKRAHASELSKASNADFEKYIYEELGKAGSSDGSNGSGLNGLLDYMSNSGTALETSNDNDAAINDKKVVEKTVPNTEGKDRHTRKWGWNYFKPVLAAVGVAAAIGLGSYFLNKSSASDYNNAIPAKPVPVIEYKAPAPDLPPAAVKLEKIHVVKDGECLDRIVGTYLAKQDGKRPSVREVVNYRNYVTALNGLQNPNLRRNPNLIHPGDNIIMSN
jgi:hypothetical protein